MKSVVLASFDRLPSLKGACAHVLLDARALLERYEVSLVTLGDEPLPGFRHLPVRLAEPNWLKRALAFHARMRRVFEENRFDAYHVRSPFEGLAVPAGETLVFEANAFYSVEMPAHFPALLGLPGAREKLRRLEDALLDRASVVVTPSRVTAGYVQDRGVEPGRIAVVPNAPCFEPVQKETEPAARAAGQPIRLCYHGTLAPWQGLSELVRALPALGRSFQLTVLTDASRERRRALEKLAAHAGLDGRVSVRDALPPAALRDFLATQDVAVAPLTPCERNLVQGCMPIKLLDALAASLPVLAPEMPVVREVVGPDYPLYARWSRTSLLDQLRVLCDDAELRRALGRSGRERVLSLYSRAAHRDALLAVYARIAS